MKHILATLQLLWLVQHCNEKSGTSWCVVCERIHKNIKYRGPRAKNRTKLCARPFGQIDAHAREALDPCRSERILNTTYLLLSRCSLLWYLYYFYIFLCRWRFGTITDGRRPLSRRTRRRYYLSIIPDYLHRGWCCNVGYYKSIILYGRYFINGVCRRHTCNDCSSRRSSSGYL